MADFAQLGTAAAPALGWTADDFLSAYENNRQRAVLSLLESTPLASAVIDFAKHGTFGLVRHPNFSTFSTTASVNRYHGRDPGSADSTRGRRHITLLTSYGV